MDAAGRLDFASPDADPRFSAAEVWTRGPGRMFGVLVGRDRGDGRPVTLRAFSGQLAGSWRVPGWVGPVAGLTHESAAYAEYRGRIEALSERLRRGDDVKRERRALSHELIAQVQGSYRTWAADGTPLGLREVFVGHCRARGVEPPALGRGPGRVPAFPAGTGDCCAPKLLHAAARGGVEPAGLVEFWYGAPPSANTPQGDAAKAAREARGEGGGGGRPGRRRARRRRGRPGWMDVAEGAGGEEARAHKSLYGPCPKCRAILGSMLHGV